MTLHILLLVYSVHTNKSTVTMNLNGTDVESEYSIRMKMESKVALPASGGNQGANSEYNDHLGRKIS